jgi:hypothetical protein
LKNVVAILEHLQHIQTNYPRKWINDATEPFERRIYTLGHERKRPGITRRAAGLVLFCGLNYTQTAHRLHLQKEWVASATREFCRQSNFKLYNAGTELAESWAPDLSYLREHAKEFFNLKKYQNVSKNA